MLIRLLTRYLDIKLPGIINVKGETKFQAGALAMEKLRAKQYSWPSELDGYVKSIDIQKLIFFLYI